MQTLKQLKSGQLIGANTLKLSEGLTLFPHEIFTLASTLERLDMTGNALDALPDNFHKLEHLKVLFLSDNDFTELPSVLAKCPKLSMIGFRNNHIKSVAENALPLSTQWLILTDNEIEKLPESMGNLTELQKCMLSGNQLSSLPESMSRCHNLELLRISANQLSALPSFLLSLPKLSWLAYSGNPFCDKHPDANTAIKEITWESLQIKEILGEGASGTVYKALWQTQEVALKVFKGSMTSDGLPQEEMDINISLGQHPHLIDVLAKVTQHPEGKDVLMLELIPSHYFNLGLPPTFDTCTRDVYPDGFALSCAHVLKILQGIASAALHMHQHGIMHGDFYAHNIMIDHEGNSILGDFGGASYFEPQNKEIRHGLERLEVRAFGCLIEEMLILCNKDTNSEISKNKLIDIKAQCLSQENQNRPLFNDIFKAIHSI